MKKRIIVTDDDPGIQDIFKIILEREGFEVELVNNGQDIMNNGYELPDLFILDRQLSGVDGLDICKYLKERKETTHIPVIMVSANPNIGTMAKEAGANDYIEKPFDIKFLLKVIHRYV